MISVVVTGSINKYGLLTGPIPNSNSLSKNEWDFKVISLTITPLKSDINEIYEIGCSLNTSTCYNYDSNRFVDKNTPLMVQHIKLVKFETATVNLSDSIPWTRVDNDSDKLSISVFEAGTDIPLPENSLALVAHVIIRRIQ